MDTKILVGAVLVIVGIGGGFWYMQQATQPTVLPTTENVQVPDGGAAGTMPAGSEMPENGMVGGDAAPVSADTYTLAQVAEHATAESCWSAVNGMVYDLTKWIPLHPGGEAKIKAICGKDGTAAFTGKHGGQEKPEATLATFKIGVLAQ